MGLRLFRRGRGGHAARVAVIGLDCAEPSLVFDRWAGGLPALDGLRSRGLYGELESVVPAITVPAWSCMTSGKDPGTLGVYGFRNRSDRSYDGLRIATSSAVQEPRLWEILSAAGKEVIALGVPQTYPPRPVNGCLVSSFLTPNIRCEYTYPAALRDDIARWVGEYMLDVKGFRTDDKDWLLGQIYEMTRKRFEVARRLVRGRRWNFFMMVEMGVDRIHHGFWKDFDETHRHHAPGSPYRDAILDYHRYVDGEVASLLDCFDRDTHVFVVSDHGARRMDGGICLNEWLLKEGYLALAAEPDAAGGPKRLEEIGVDWSRTRAWGDGGYYGRLFLNVRGREPQGTVAPEEREELLAEIAAKLEALGDERGRPIGTRCFRPEHLYHEVRGVAPDLVVYFGDLAWRSIGTVGWGRVHVLENDTGPDDANHAQHGIFIYADPDGAGGGRRVEGLHLMQIAPTVLRLLGVSPPPGMQRPPVPEVAGR